MTTLFKDMTKYYTDNYKKDWNLSSPSEHQPTTGSVQLPWLVTTQSGRGPGVARAPALLHRGTTAVLTVMQCCQLVIISKEYAV